MLGAGLGMAGRWWQSEPVLTQADIDFDGQQAFEYLETLCELGPRPSGSAAMVRQQELISAHFLALGAEVERQEFRTLHPVEKKPVPMCNLLIRFHPERHHRVLLATHYDTRPFPDRDREHRQGEFIGANGAASGTALLMALGKRLGDLKGRYGVDLAFFDGEGFVFRKGNSELGQYSLGAEWFSQQEIVISGTDQPVNYRWGVVVEMIGDQNLRIHQERHSLSWEDSKPLVNDLWSTAAQLGVREFIAQPKYELRGDHVKLHQLGNIPCCLISDFDYGGRWQTVKDTPEACSPLSLAKVGTVLFTWLQNLK